MVSGEWAVVAGGHALTARHLRFSPFTTGHSPLTIPMKARIKITLKTGVLDPQGKAIENALRSLGIGGVDGVRQGKYIEVDLKMCRDLLANTVIENYSYEIAR